MASGPSAVQFGNKFYVYAKGSDNMLWLRRYNPDIQDPAQRWEAWVLQGSARQLADAPAVTTYNGMIYVFIRSSDNHLYHRFSSDGVAWTSWSDLDFGQPTGRMTSAPSAVPYGTKLYVYTKDSDNKLSLKKWDGATWLPWSQRADGVLADAPGAEIYQGTIHVYVRALDNKMYETWSADGEVFSSWNPLGGSITSAPAAVEYLGLKQASFFLRRCPRRSS